MTDHRPIRAAGEATLLAPAQPGYGRFVLAIAALLAFVGLGFRCVFFAAGNQRDSATAWVLRLTRFVHTTVEQ